jgi:hypothetical protein
MPAQKRSAITLGLIEKRRPRINTGKGQEKDVHDDDDKAPLFHVRERVLVSRYWKGCGFETPRTP